ncbi:MAG: nucleotide exchange factor GrpE [Candidatus Paracaedibacteraceae bacterium]|nr:nucleotide exchange factor GrpE [Candidatus Paracaedibacteraceae bacterium]
MTASTKNNETQNEQLKEESVSLEALDALEEEVAVEPTLEEQLSEMKDQWMRAVAEGENIRRRAQRDKEDATRYAPLHLARDIVSICDNLRRAMDACGKEDLTQLSPNTQGLVTGVELIVKELDKVFDKNNIKRIHPLHEKFDPNFHQAMFEVESNDHPSGTVMTVMQDGYLFYDRLLRPAMVGVSKSAISETH